MATAETAVVRGSATGSRAAARAGALWRYAKRNPSIIVGIVLMLVLVAFWAIGTLLTAPEDADVDSFVPPNHRPSFSNPHPCYNSDNPRNLCFAYDDEEHLHLLGVDRLGKDILASFALGIPQTLMIGFIAAIIGTSVGTVLAFVAGYYGGFIDGTIRFLVDTLQTIPGLLILIVITIAWRQLTGGQAMTILQLSLIIALLAWLGPTRVIRSQVLVLKQRSYVELARLSGMSGPEVIVREMMPNLMPFIVANFVLAVSSAILASVGLEVLGLGDFDSNTLGMMIYHNIWYGSLVNGWWWWWAPPIFVIVVLFLGLFMVSRGMDEWANPRLRRRV